MTTEQSPSGRASDVSAPGALAPGACPSGTRSPGARAYVARLAVYSLLMPIALFASAGRLDWVMGWLYVGIAFSATAVTRILLARSNPGLMEERLSAPARAEVGRLERILLLVLGLVCPLSMWLVAGFSHRTGSLLHASLPLQTIAVAAVILASCLMSWAMLENRYFSSVVRIQKDRGHVVVTTGPYRLVRHPGYLGAVIMSLASPVMLDSAWAYAPAAVSVLAIVVRTSIEDRALLADLPGYAEYARRTRSRLVPAVW
jgi:protein-S-isoprenylcysteine O-methyltransferase Ste14